MPRPYTKSSKYHITRRSKILDVPGDISQAAKKGLLRLGFLQKETAKEVVIVMIDRYLVKLNSYSTFTNEERLIQAARIVKAAEHVRGCNAAPCFCGLASAHAALQTVNGTSDKPVAFTPRETVELEASPQAIELDPKGTIPTIAELLYDSWEQQWPRLRPKLHETPTWNEFQMMLKGARPPAAFLNWTPQVQIDWLKVHAPL